MRIHPAVQWLFALATAALMIAPTNAAAQPPAFDRVFTIIMENHEFSDIVGNPAAPFINSLVAQYGVATSYVAVGHPSLPNYMALTGGEMFFSDDCESCRVDAANIADLVEASGRTWSAYMEGMTSPCGLVDEGLYAVKHNPFVHYQNISDNAARCNQVRPFSQFMSDLASGTLANYVWITPDLCHSMHDCDITTGDTWLQSVIPAIIQSPAFANAVLFLVWDEGSTSIGGGGLVPLVAASNQTGAGTQVTSSATHYDTLATVEWLWGLPALGESAVANPMAQFFNAAPTPPPGTVPAPWTNQDVGATGQPGSASFANGVFTVSGAGADIWGTQDGFQFVDQAVSGDVTIVARVTGMQNTGAYAKAGVMIRATTAPGSPHVILDLNPNGNIEFMTRSTQRDVTTFVAGMTTAVPVWLSLAVTGSSVTAAVSADGANWTTVGTTSVTFGPGLVGLVVCSQDASTLNTATFDNVGLF